MTNKQSKCATRWTTHSPENAEFHRDDHFLTRCDGKSDSSGKQTDCRSSIKCCINEREIVSAKPMAVWSVANNHHQHMSKVSLNSRAQRHTSHMSLHVFTLRNLTLMTSIGSNCRGGHSHRSQATRKNIHYYLQRTSCPHRNSRPYGIQISSPGQTHHTCQSQRNTGRISTEEQQTNNCVMTFQSTLLIPT